MAQAGDEAASAASSRCCGDKQIKRNASAGRRHGGAGAAGHSPTGDRCPPTKRRRRVRPAEQLTPVYRLAIGAAGPQGRSQAHRRHRQADARKTPRCCSSKMPTPRKCSWPGRARFISRSRSRSCKAATASSFPPAPRACPTARPSANPPPRAAATSARSGGHGQFGDVVLEIAPAPRGAGFVFHDRIKGGVVPKQWIGSVEKGVAGIYEVRPAGFPGGGCRRWR